MIDLHVAMILALRALDVPKSVHYELDFEHGSLGTRNLYTMLKYEKPSVKTLALKAFAMQNLGALCQ